MSTYKGQGGDVVCHQWDFCGGWHFLGPPSWHWNFSYGVWDKAESVIRQGLREYENLARISNHPAFVFPHYDGNLTNTEANAQFVEQYQRTMAFQMTKEFKLVYSRSLDIADYYRRHFSVTPRTVFVSKTDSDKIMYVMQYHNLWAGRHELLARERIPWLTRISTILNLRLAHYGAKDPMSYEYIVFEDQKRSIRFERESPNPIWWFDYTKQEQELTPEGSTIKWVATPDVDIACPPEVNADGVGRPPCLPKWVRQGNQLVIKMKMLTKAEFPDYGIALWGLPEDFTRNPDPDRIKTNAKEFIIAKNTDGEYHLLLFFDLKPDLPIDVSLLLP